MKNKVKTWLVSDTHFFHQKLVDMKERTIDNTERIIDEWNSVIGPDDRVIHCGDFAFGEDLEKIEEVVNLLNGRVTLILGNHDTPIKVRKVYRKYFKCMGVLHEDKIVYSHYPVHPATLEELCTRLTGHNERFNIHGHMHNRCVPDKRYFNVNWDMVFKSNISKPNQHILNLEDVYDYLTSINPEIPNNG